MSTRPSESQVSSKDCCLPSTSSQGPVPNVHVLMGSDGQHPKASKGVKRNRRRSTKEKNRAKKKKEKTIRMPENRPWTCHFCRLGQHSWKVCPVRKDWMATKDKMSYRDWIASVPVCDHDGVTYRPSVEEMGELPHFISNSVRNLGDEIGGFSVIPPIKPRNTFGKLILKPCVHPLRQDYVKLEEGVYRREAIKAIRGSGLGKFMAKTYMASLSTSGFGSLGPDGQNWKGFYYLFDEGGTTPNKPGPEYVLDKNASIFEKGESTWHLGNLDKSFTPYLKNPAAEKIPGVNAPQLLIGGAQSYTALHVENLNLASVNFLHDGKAKYWIVIPAKYRWRLLRLLKKLYPEDYKNCDHFECHKDCFVLPQVLRAAEPPIPFDCIKQEEGHYVVTHPGAFHMVVNMGSNCAEAINVCIPEWEKFAKLPECSCSAQPEMEDVRIAFNLPDVSPPIDVVDAKFGSFVDRRNERPVAVEENASDNNPVHENSDSDEDVAMPKRAANRKAARLVSSDDDDAVDMPATSRPQRPVSPVETQSSQDVALADQVGVFSTRGNRGGLRGRGRGGRGRPRARASVPEENPQQVGEEPTPEVAASTSECPRARLRPRTKAVYYNYD